MSGPFVIHVPNQNNLMVISPNYGEEPKGPTGYPSDSRKLQGLLYVYVVFLVLAKFGQIALCVGPNLADFGNTNVVLFMPILFIGFFVSMINPWLVIMVFIYQPCMTLNRYSFHRLIRAPFFYLMLADNFLMIGIPVIGLVFKLDTASSIFCGVFLAALNVTWFLLGTMTEFADHMPLLLNDNYLFAGEQQVGTNDNFLRIVESSAFKIVLYNAGKEKFSGELTIVRKTLEPYYGYFQTRRNGRPTRYSSTTCKFDVWIDPDYTIDPDGFMTLIPEYHRIPAALRIKNFRSFGYNRRSVVETALFMGDKELIKLTQNYRPLVPGLTARRFRPTATRDVQRASDSNSCPVSE